MQKIFAPETKIKKDVTFQDKDDVLKTKIAKDGDFQDKDLKDSEFKDKDVKDKQDVFLMYPYIISFPPAGNNDDQGCAPERIIYAVYTIFTVRPRRISFRRLARTNAMPWSLFSFA